MAVKSISVSQLRCACLDPDWLARWLRGENPSTMGFAPPGTPAVYGLEFHALTRKMVEWLVHPSSAGAAGRLREESQFFAALNRLGAEEILNRILDSGQVDSAAALIDALHNFCLRLRQLRESCSRFQNWQQIFVAQEYAIKDVPFFSGKHSLFVSGIVDCLRMHPAARLEIVDYKLTQGSDLPKELVQVALYRALLRKAYPGFEYCGTLEYFLPDLHLLELSSGDLEQAFSELVQPVLGELAGKAAPATQAPASSFSIGHTREKPPQKVRLEAGELNRHAAFLGGSGSGKTTLALHVVEQLLLAGIPAILVDRKGDLCRYAQPEAWQEPLKDPTLQERRKRLREAVDVNLYTPGHSGGRPIAISIVPSGMAELDPAEQEQTAKIAASALAAMMKFKSSAADQARLAILTRAILVLAQQRPQEKITLDALLEFINAQDESLLEAIGFLGSGHLKKLTENLQTLQIMNGDLLADYPESLQAEALFGLGSWKKEGRTRLSILSTKFLADRSGVLFWVAQLLVELGRFAGRNPSNRLQGVVLFDEADLYLPAVAKPPTKEPMENLLRRARSAGLGILLASQSPGDFDYRCKENVRTWFVGLVKEPTALEKMKPMLAEARTDVTERLPSQKVGQFFVIREGQVQSLQADHSLLRTEQLSETEILALARTRTGA